MATMHYSQLDTQTQQAVDIFRTLPPEGQDMILAFTEALLQQQEREEAERYSAVRNAIKHARINVIKQAETVIGRRYMEVYRNYPEAMAGIGYAAGIAEGKRIERARRRTKGA